MAVSNTVSLSTNFNIDPYYDDFNESKNFHRILFRPGLAVQARELTQLQTILQNQIDRFGEHIFQEGSVVRGIELFYDKNTPYVQLLDQDFNGNTISVSAFSNTQISNPAGVTANVVTVTSGTQAGTVKNTLYLTYTSLSTDGTQSTFANGEQLTAGNARTANVITSATSTGTGSILRLGPGVIFAKDHFIRCAEQTVVVGNYSANTSKRVGYVVNETVVSSTDDTTLLDPAQGSFNFTAPGANRLKLEPVLTVKDIDSENDTDFVEIVRIRNGNIERKADKPLYSQINDYIARRTYAESGHYIVDGLNLKLREHLNTGNNNGVFTAAQGGNTSQLSVDVKPGQAYVFGYERDNLTTQHVAVDKGIDVTDVNAGSVTSNYGNYVVVKNVVGQWDYNSHGSVSLRDEEQNAIANGDFSSTVVGNEIGTARVRSLEYVSGDKGSPAATYNMYLYDINMSANTFADVKSVYYDGTTDGRADVVLTSGSAVLQEQNFNVGLFEMPATAIRRLRDSTGTIDTSYIFNKSFDVTISASGTFTLSTGNANERFQDTGAQSATQKNQNFYVVLNATATSSASIDTGSMTDGANTITGLTDADTKFNVGEVIKLGSHSNTFTVSAVTSTTLSTFENAAIALSSNTIVKQLPAGTVIDMAGVGGDGADRSINIPSSTSATFDLQETLTSGVSATVLVRLNRVSAREKAKTLNVDRYMQIQVANNTGSTTGPWNLGVADVFKLKEVRKKSSVFTSLTEGTVVTDDFTIDTGQRDNLYTLGSLLKKTNSTLSISSGDFLLVKFDFFSEDASQGSGFYSVDSYPVDDVNASNTTAITTAEIPRYISPTTGTEYDLRDVIDIRPRITDTANNVTTFTNISTNPSNTQVVLESTGNSLRYASPNENFTVDYSFFLPRVDRIILDKEGNFRSIKGTSALNAVVPASPPDGFTLGVVRIAPFPSTIANFDYVPGANTTENSFVIEERIRGYTMKDIGTLETRINNLEYYSSLNLLEQSTQSLNINDGNGLNRFKSGFLVDNFVDTTIGENTDEDFKAFVDIGNKELTPRRFDAFTELNFNDSNSTNVVRSSGDVRVTVATATAFANGETVSAGAATGTVRYVVGDRLYIENVSGTFPTSGTISGATSGESATISATFEYADGKLVTLPYTHDLIIDSSYASDTRNAAGIAYTWEGIVTLDPATDFWIDTVNLPPNRQTVDIDVGNQGRTIFRGDPATPWAQRLIDQGRTNLPVRRRETQTNVLSRSVNVTTNVEGSRPIPFIRAQNINFTAQGLKPNATVYPFFDGTDVSSFVQPANSSFANTGNLGTALKADSTGKLYGIFQLPNSPNQRFETGTSVFRLIDNINNTRQLGTFTTVAESNFTATGTQQLVRDTVVTTREIETVNVTVLYDPLGQTFRIEDSINDGSNDIRRNPSTTSGMFLTKLDLFFATKDDSLPCEIQIREVDPSSGFITPRIVPFGKVIVQPEDINVNPTSPVPTPIYFDTPIYLLSDVDYAIVIKPGGGSPNYNVFIARMGETDITTGNRIVANPYSGLLFVSANDRNWKSIQEEDVTFKAYFANFGTNQSGTMAMNNIASEFFNVSNTSVNLARSQSVHGESTIVFTSQPAANVGIVFTGATTGATGTVTANTGSGNNPTGLANTFTIKDVSLSSKFQAGESVGFTFANGVSTGVANATIHTVTTPTGVIEYINANEPEDGRMTLKSVTGTFTANTQFKEQVSGYTGKIDSVVTLKADESIVRFGLIDLDETRTTLTGKMATSTTTLDASFNPFTKNGVTFFDNRKFVVGSAQETAGLSGSKSADFRLALRNLTNSRHSPAIDVDRLGLISTEFFTNNDDTSETDNRGGNATARYITKTVTLAEGLDAEDLKVLLTAYKPSVATIKVYAKLLNNEDSATIDERPYVELSQTTLATVSSRDEDKSDFLEFEYNLPTSVLTGASDEFQYTSGGVTYTGYKFFKIKIVLLTSNTAKAAKIKDLRAIALQK